MRKYVIILLVFILILTSSCTKKENEEPNIPANNVNDNDDDDSAKSLDNNNQDDKANDENSNNDENNEIDEWLFEVYKGISITDGDDIYYIDDDRNNLYSIKKDGSEKTLIHQQERMYQVQIYNNKLYVYSSVYTDSKPSETVIPGKIVTMNKDGSDVKELDLGIEYTTLYYPAGFWIYEDFLFLAVNNFTVPYDGMFNLVDYYKYDLKSGSLSNIHNNLDGGDSPNTYGDYCYYIISEEREHTLYKFNIYTDEKSSIAINKRENSDYADFIYSDFQIEDNYIYYHSKTYINRDKLDGTSDTETIFENEGFIIVSMAITDEYVFFINMEEYSQENIDNDTMNLTIRRIKRDGSELKIIYTETMRSTNLAPSSVRIMVEDNALKYRNRLTDTYKFMDFDGKILE